jgi:predicted esterase
MKAYKSEKAFLHKVMIGLLILAPVASSCLLPGRCLSEDEYVIVYLKNGDRLEGRLLRQDDNGISVSIYDDTAEARFSKGEIEKIEKGSRPIGLPKLKIRWNTKGEKGGIINLTLKLLADWDHKIIERPGYLLYVPEGLEKGKEHPLVLVLSPSADAWMSMATWRALANRHKWLICASKEFRNGQNLDVILPRLAALITDDILPNYPVNSNNIIAAGYSGGGIASQALAYKYPQLIRAVIVNSGMIHEYYLQDPQAYPRGKIAVYLASPTDYRYGKMKRDREFLKDLGWKVKWIEFFGGHRIAPGFAYRKAVEWLIEN